VKVWLFTHFNEWKKKIENKTILKKDNDECELGTDNCHSEATCANIIGSYTCSCNNGYSGDGFNCEGVITYSFFFLKKRSMMLTFPNRY